jgi:two-component system, response regulator YesN
MNEWGKIEDFIETIIGKISFVGITQSDLQYVFLQYVAALSDTCFEFSLQLSDIFGERFKINRKLSDVSTMEDLKTQMITLAQKIFKKLEEKKQHIHQDMIDKILVYIQENIDKNITLESIAEKVFMHPAYLSRICKSVTGVSLGEQIVLSKIQKAKELLTWTNNSVSDISERLGYTTPRAFYRIFKDYTGFTPSDFRKQEGLKKIIK